MAKKGKGTAVVDDDVVDDLDLDDVQDDDEAESAPAKKGKAEKEETVFGVKDLAEYLSKKLKKTITPRDLRTQIRRMAREEKPRVQREIIAGNKARYAWPNGLEEPEVKRIIKAVAGGELEEAKKEALAKLKEQKAAKDAAAGKGAKAGKKGKKTKPAKEEADVEDLDLDDDDDSTTDDDDE